MLRSAVWGAAAAVAAVVLVVVATLVLPLLVPYAISRFTGEGGMSAGYVDSNTLLLAAAVGFALGFAWKQRAAR
jgi:hypothetical protein